MKIHNFDPEYQGIEVSFASDETNSQNPEDYTRYNFDANTFSHCVTKEDIVESLLATGNSICADIVARENVKDNSGLQSLFTELSDTTHEGYPQSASQDEYENEVTL